MCRSMFISGISNWEIGGGYPKYRHGCLAIISPEKLDFRTTLKKVIHNSHHQFQIVVSKKLFLKEV
jgi:hypothetical protein